MATHDRTDHNTRVYDRKNKTGWGIGTILAILVVGLIAWWVWPDDDVAVTGAVPPPAAVEAPAVPPTAAPVPAVPAARP